jgi:hypothetical protein
MRLVQISAWNDSGGGFTHRLLDGHPGLRSWPFELLLGRDGIDVDRFGHDWFRGRFRWPRFDAATLAARDGTALFDLVSDAELKGVLRDPSGAKHRDFPIAVDLAAWRSEAARRWSEDGRFTQGSFIECYMETFLTLLDGRTEDDRPVLAHCPCAIVDAPETWADLPDTRFVSVIRSPLSGFADMSRRHTKLDPARYAAKWSLVNGASLLWAGKVPDRVRIVTLPSLLGDRDGTMRDLCSWLGLPFDDSVMAPSWRGARLSEDAMGPFGGVPSVSLERERTLAIGLDPEVRNALQALTASTAAILSDTGLSLSAM